MSYCLNPACPNPQNLTQTELCQACGFKLLLRDRYRIIQALGQGGFGATFLAVNESLPGQPSCVIKQLRPNANAPHVLDMARELFKREAETLGRIGTHPQIPSLLDYFEEHETFFLVQEYISGQTLQQEVKHSGPLSELQVKRFLSEILPVLDYVHQSRVIHRDIKPANMIRRSQDQKLVLIDFGAVKYQNNQPTSTEQSDQTALTSYAIGTPGFAPPEQMSMRPVPASDVYALGVSCIYLLTGKSPKEIDYDPHTGELIWEKHVHASPQFIRVLTGMLEISVKQRYKTAEEVYRALDLVDHADALAEGMNSVEARNATSKKGNDYRGPDSVGLHSSPHARLAMQIRTRQQTRLDSSALQSGWSRGRAADSGRVSTGIASRGKSSAGKAKDNSSEKKKVPARLDAEGLQSYYARGKRDFTSHDLRSLALQKANLSNASFHQSNLSKVNFQGAILHKADFGRASLTNAVLTNANLTNAYLGYADLENADLRGADLSSAYLLNANLRGANLCGANLTGAKLTEEQLATARTNWMTVRPSGKRGIW